MARFDDLLETVETYQSLAAENYDRIRKLAEEMRDGMCAYLGSRDGVCVHLVPPMGSFEPRPYGDQAFSIPPMGFRPLGPVHFGVAVRVTKGTDWLRLALECRKSGDTFRVLMEGGREYSFELPLADNDPEPFYEELYQHVRGWFQERIDRYNEGDFGTREIGFDFADGHEDAKV
ncbi:MAG: hypothetical protein AAGI03_08835 [Pseudomonadota bacterium]